MLGCEVGVRGPGPQGDPALRTRQWGAPPSLCVPRSIQTVTSPLPLPVVALVRFCSPRVLGTFWVTYPGGLQRVVDP